MTITVQTTDLRRRSREILDRVRMKREAIIIRSYDDPQAVLIPFDQYDEFIAWRKSQENRTIWLDELRKIAEEVSSRAGLSDEETRSLTREAISVVRRP
jgi:prevent-host-death family protein